MAKLQWRPSESRGKFVSISVPIFVLVYVIYLDYQLLVVPEPTSLLAEPPKCPTCPSPPAPIPAAKSNKSNLFPSWQTSLSAAAASSNSIISFKHYNLKSLLPTSVEGSTPMVPQFFYSVEETLHSANNIMQVEKEPLRAWLKYLAAVLRTDRKPNCLDVGSNGGFFSLMSRSVGCRTLAVDAQPWCLMRMSSAASVNGFDSDFDIAWTAVGEDKTSSIEVGATKCSGLWAVKKSEWINDESSRNVKVHMTPITEIINGWLATTDKIDLFKIDVEGSEMAVLHSALPLFEMGRVGLVVAEIAPGRVVEITDLEVVNETLRRIYAAGYMIHRMGSSGIGLDATLKLFSVPYSGWAEPVYFYIKKV